jgi:hypothetical protein
MRIAFSVGAGVAVAAGAGAGVVSTDAAGAGAGVAAGVAADVMAGADAGAATVVSLQLDDSLQAWQPTSKRTASNEINDPPDLRVRYFAWFIVFLFFLVYGL